MPRLRRILARAVFLGIAATQNGCCCPADPDVEIEVEADLVRTPELAALIDRCAASAGDCVALCMAALEDALGDEPAYFQVVDCEVTPLATGARVRATYYDGSACGRAPGGLLACEVTAGAPVVRWLARAAYLEAASVVAFVHLAADLVHHRAPQALVDAAIVAAFDEVRHAAMLRTLIAGRGHVPVPQIVAYRPAALRDLALHNAIEGCARETIGAAINLWQASRARDPELRAVFARIARDELAHAELGWAIHAWALGRLDPADAAAVVEAQRVAIGHVVDGLALDPATRVELGLPTDAEVRSLVAALR